MEKIKCFNCGYNQHTGSLHIHHIDGNHQNNEELNLMVLCANCHFEYHQKNPIKKKKRKEIIEINKHIKETNSRRIQQLEIETDILNEQIENMNIEIEGYKQYLEKKNKQFSTFIEELLKQMDGYYYQNKRVLNELYEKTL